MIIAYGENLAVEIAEGIRRILRASWYRASFSCRISPDHARVSDFATTAGGGVYAVPIGGQLTGLRCRFHHHRRPARNQGRGQHRSNRIRQRPL
jgi:hypothetical protein